MEPSKFITPGLLKYVVGDVCQPRGGGHKLILQCVNDEGKYGAGVSGALAKRWPKVQEEYRKWYRSQKKFVGGEIQVIDVQTDVAVINMIAQHSVRLAEDGTPPVRYEWLRTCLNKVGELASYQGSAVAAPRICSGLAGGMWSEVEPMIIDLIIKRGVNVTIYDLEIK